MTPDIELPDHDFVLFPASKSSHPDLAGIESGTSEDFGEWLNLEACGPPSIAFPKNSRPQLENGTEASASQKTPITRCNKSSIQFDDVLPGLSDSGDLHMKIRNMQWPEMGPRHFSEKMWWSRRAYQGATQGRSPIELWQEVLNTVDENDFDTLDNLAALDKNDIALLLGISSASTIPRPESYMVTNQDLPSHAVETLMTNDVYLRNLNDIPELNRWYTSSRQRLEQRLGVPEPNNEIDCTVSAMIEALLEAVQRVETEVGRTTNLSLEVKNSIDVLLLARLGVSAQDPMTWNKAGHLDTSELLLVKEDLARLTASLCAS